MAGFKQLIRTITTGIPEIRKPLKKTSLNEKLIWTAIALVLYLVMAQTPLFGIDPTVEDQLASLRVIFASASGTLMELGIGPIVTAGLIMQLLKGADIIKVDMRNPDDRAFFMSATKLLTLIVIVVEAAVFIAAGRFGANLSFSVVGVIFIQLFVAGLIVMLLDELIQKGWGLGSGLSLFILAGVTQQILWSIFSILPAGDGPIGIIPYIIESGFQNRIMDALFRTGQLPSIFALALTILVIVIIIYIEGMRVEIPITSTRYRGFAGVYPIKLLYTSVIPIILVSALMANITVSSNFLWSAYNRLGDNPFLNWIAVFDPNSPSTPIGGFVYWITPPVGIEGVGNEPFRAITYVLFFIILSIMFGRLWVDVGGLSSKNVAKNLLEADVQIPGFRRSDSSVEIILNKYIPPVTVISGAFLGLLASTSNLLGVFGSGIGILLMCDIIINYYQLLTREHVEENMPMVAGLMGAGAK